MEDLNNWANKAGTSSRKCSCATWIDHWLNFSNCGLPQSCSVFGCSNPPTLGAHVFHPNVEGEQIIPMCISCNNNPEYFDIKSNAVIVSANKSLTCG